MNGSYTFKRATLFRNFLRFLSEDAASKAVVLC